MSKTKTENSKGLPRVLTDEDVSCIGAMSELQAKHLREFFSPDQIFELLQNMSLTGYQCYILNTIVETGEK